METTRIAFLVLAFGALILAGVLTYNLLSAPAYQPITQGQVQQYTQQPVYVPPQNGLQVVDTVQAYAAFNVLPPAGG